MTAQAQVADATEAFLEEAFPKGMMSLLLTPSGPEKEALLIQLVGKALRDGTKILVGLSNIPPRRFLRRLSSQGLSPDKGLKAGKLKVLDWYSHKEEDVQEISEDGGVLRCPGDLGPLEGALSELLASADGEGLATLEILTDVHGIAAGKAGEFVKTLRKKLVKAYDVSVLVLDAQLTDENTVEELRGMADGVVEVERVRSREAITWTASIQKEGKEVGRYALKAEPPFLEFVPDVEEAAPPEGEAEEESQPCPQCGTPLEGEECNVCGYTEDDSRLWKIKEIYERCEEKLKEDPKDLDALFTKAAALARMKEYDPAIGVLNELTKHDPRYPGIWMLKAKIYDRLGDEVKANLCRQRALELQEKEMGVFLEARVQPEGEKFQCPLCQRWLPMDATVCQCGAEFVEEEEG